jgi:L-arabinose isomerase
MKKLYFVVGSQDLYGEETLRKVKEDSEKMAAFLNQQLSGMEIGVSLQPTIRNSDEAETVLCQASNDPDCLGVIAWMHTFSPAKMWVSGLQALRKPMIHLATQANEKLPYETIDMDFMNLNQSAHGDREFSFILNRLGIPHAIAVGYYRDPEVVEQIRQFARVANAIDRSRRLKTATFGNNMREVAVTDGDRLESQIRYGWQTNYYGIGDWVDLVAKVTDKEVEEQLKIYRQKYVLAEPVEPSVVEQAKYEVAMHRFIKETGIGAFTDNFQDLHGLRQLPGLAVQDLMDEGIGFGPEGDYKTACLDAVLMAMSEHEKGGTGFIEDYTYDLTPGKEVELGSHMLEVSPRLAKNKPVVETHPLGIGGKEDPARLVFAGITGKGIQTTMIDLGDHFRLIAMPVELIDAPEMPKLPVARLLWKIRPSFKEGLRFWLENGGGHHSVISTALTIDDLALFAELTRSEFVALRE